MTPAGDGNMGILVFGESFFVVHVGVTLGLLNIL